jgi:hypothetical protein
MTERKKQSRLIRKWKPWELSTGPKTTEGIENSKMNAVKYDCHNADIRAAAKLITESRRMIRELLLREFCEEGKQP